METLRIGEICSGIGGLGSGLEAAGAGEVVWHAEIDAGAASVLADRWPGVPNLGDLSAVDWADVEAVDLLCGGIPCQAASLAGARKGRADERWLWPEAARAISALRPKVFVLENVPGLLTIDDGEGFGDIVGGLAEMGYDAVWGLLGAWQVGAAHRRDRLFLVATDGAFPRARLRPGRVVGERRDGAWASAQAGLFGDAGVSGWPRAGVLVSGVVMALPHSPWVHRSGLFAAVGLAFLPTPTATERERSADEAAQRHLPGRAMGRNGGASPGLSSVVALLPTPPAINPNDLDDAVLTLLPTPVAGDGERASLTYERGNPTLVGALLRTLQANLTEAKEGITLDGRTPEDPQVGLVDQIMALLPTPTTGEAVEGLVVEGLAETDGSAAPAMASGAVPLFPTPRASDTGTAGRRASEGFRPPLSAVVLPMADTDAEEPIGVGGWGIYESAVRRWEAVFGEAAPAPVEIGPKGSPRLSPDFVRWLMGFPQGHGAGLVRNVRLKCYGNSVVPHVASAVWLAFVELVGGTVVNCAKHDVGPVAV